jgi:trehalose synthase
MCATRSVSSVATAVSGHGKSSSGVVAEMLVSLLASARGAGIDARWVVIAGNEDFVVLTKRIHNFLHGSSGDGGELDDDTRRAFDEVTERNAAEFRELSKPGDVVIIQEPQSAGLIPAIRDIGCPTVGAVKSASTSATGSRAARGSS